MRPPPVRQHPRVKLAGLDIDAGVMTDIQIRAYPGQYSLPGRQLLLRQLAVVGQKTRKVFGRDGFAGTGRKQNGQSSQQRQRKTGSHGAGIPGRYFYRRVVISPGRLNERYGDKLRADCLSAIAGRCPVCVHDAGILQG